MVSRTRAVLGILLALFLISGTAVFSAVGVEAVLGIELPFFDVSDAAEAAGGQLNESQDWVIRNATRVQLRDDYRTRQSSNSTPTSYCLRTRTRASDDRTEIYSATPQRFQNRSINDTVTEEVCPGTHPVFLRPRTTGRCSMTERDFWMLGHIGMDASIIQCDPDRFIIYTDDDFAGKELPVLSDNASSGGGTGGVPVTLG